MADDTLRVARAIDAIGYNSSMRSKAVAAMDILDYPDKCRQFVTLVRGEEVTARYDDGKCQAVAECIIRRYTDQPVNLPGYLDPKKELYIMTDENTPEEVTESPAKPAKKAKGEGKAVQKASKDGPGVIDIIKSVLTSPEGGTVQEIHAELVKTFPERPPEGMLATCKIQVNRLHKQGKLVIEKEQVEGRGLVYRGTLPTEQEIDKTKAEQAA